MVVSKAPVGSILMLMAFSVLAAASRVSSAVLALVFSAIYGP